VPFSNNIPLKKHFGQHFLRNRGVVLSAIERVHIDETTSIFEIGCGDGFLTQEILRTPMARLWVFEIDPQWAQYVKNTFGGDQRMSVYEDNILDIDWSMFDEHQPWTLIANLPYQVTFPILRLLQRERHKLREGVIMVQEEVAQKIVKKSGRGYGYISLFFQHYFEWELMNKVPPGAFFPPPKIFSRLMHFKPRQQVQEIPDEPGFWKFIKLCSHQPRRTLRNNLMQTHLSVAALEDDLLNLRAQQLDMQRLLALWAKLR
jgi:16S rRNA (adenine1518-N6/adenine1519-N6)-dimethyltransferase